MDRNIGDSTSGEPSGTILNIDQVLRFATYIHGLSSVNEGHVNDINFKNVGLIGKLRFDDLEAEGYKDFEWEINTASLIDGCFIDSDTNQPIQGSCFWGPILDNINIKDLNPKTKVGWRGPAIDQKYLPYLHQQVVIYNNSENDYAPFMYNDFLSIARKV